MGGRGGINKNEQDLIVDVSINKFEGYIFNPKHDDGKEYLFNQLGYYIEHSPILVLLYKEQGGKQFKAGNYVVKGLNENGNQRLAIKVLIHGIGESIGKAGYFETGWEYTPSPQTIRLTSPFVGFWAPNGRIFAIKNQYNLNNLERNDVKMREEEYDDLENHELMYKRVRLLTDKYEKDYNVKKGYEGAILQVLGKGFYEVDVSLDKKGNSVLVSVHETEMEVIPFAKKKDTQ